MLQFEVCSAQSSEFRFLLPSLQIGIGEQAYNVRAGCRGLVDVFSQDEEPLKEPSDAKAARKFGSLATLRLRGYSDERRSYNGVSGG